MATLDTVSLDIAVVLGRTDMPVHQVLRLGRGAIIELDAGEDDDVEILANNFPVARGTVAPATATWRKNPRLLNSPGDAPSDIRQPAQACIQNLALAKLYCKSIFRL